MAPGCLARPARSTLAAVRLILPLLVSLVLAVALSRVDLLPPGPTTDYSEVGEGSDLDIQLEMATVAASYGGALPWWDPYPDFGQPLLANPEAFVGHPGFLLGAGDPARGVRWIYGMQLLVLFLGACWLAVGLGLPWWTGPPAVLPLLASVEWQDRIGVGHFMVIGLSAVPAVAAGWLAGLRRPLLAAGAGAAIGLASLGGGHYPTVFSVLLVLVATWGWVAGPRWSVVLVGFLALRLALPLSLELPDRLAEVLVAGLLLGGLWTGRARLRRGTELLVAVALGVLAVAGWRLVPSWLVVWMNFRASGYRGMQVEPLDLGMFVAERGRTMEELLFVPHTGWWLALLGGLVALAFAARPDEHGRRPARALALAAAACVLLGWGAGRPLEPWRIVALVPGLSAINYPLRLQWFLLLLPAFGWLLATARLGRRLPGPPWLAPTVLAAALAGLALPRAELQPYPPASAPTFAPAGRARAVLTGGSDEALSRTSARGLVRPGFATGIGFLPLEAPQHEGAALAVAEAERQPGEGWPAVVEAPVEVALVRDTLRLRGPANQQVRVAQRDVRGWRCDGGELISYPEDDSLDVRMPRRGNNWLRVRIGATGEATCRYRAAGVTWGVLLQVLAGALLVGLGARTRRRPPDILQSRPQARGMQDRR